MQAGNPSAAGWSDARRAWDALPADVAGVYQRRATAALLSPQSCPQMSVQHPVRIEEATWTLQSAPAKLTSAADAVGSPHPPNAPLLQAHGAPEADSAQDHERSTGLMRPQQVRTAGHIRDKAGGEEAARCGITEMRMSKQTQTQRFH